MTGHAYRTGDRHPTDNLLAFVEYCEEGHEIWTSIGGDIEAPYRLANLNAQRRAAGMRICSRIEDIEPPSEHRAFQERL
jgi:hypothetical protein